MPPHLNDVIGRVLPAPENHLSADKLELARKARRSFMGKALAMGAGVAASATAATRAVAAEGEEAILKLPTHTTGLGQSVATDGYGKPSQWEANLQRRQSPGLTRVPQASVSFTPLQGLFGIITHRPLQAPLDGQRSGEARARVHHGRPHAPAQRLAHPFH